MKPAAAVVTAGTLLLIAAGLRPTASDAVAAAPTTVLIVRHADRDGEKDALTAAGLARAQELVHVASKASVAAIYCTKTERSRKTAQPLATALKLAPVESDPADVDGMVKRLLADHRGRTVVVVGHSNTVPKIVAALGGPKIPDLAENEFDDLFVLTVGADPATEAKLVTLQYGAASP